MAQLFVRIYVCLLCDSKIQVPFYLCLIEPKLKALEFLEFFNMENKPNKKLLNMSFP